jgi:hypothetical protein
LGEGRELADGGEGESIYLGEGGGGGGGFDGGQFVVEAI